MAGARSKPLILITGGSGFVGSHILRTFLGAGYAVRAAVRAESSSRKILKQHGAYENNISFSIVPDITAPNAFDEAVKGVDGVVHSASPFVTKVTDNEQDLLLPAIRGTTELLQSIEKYAQGVKRVVITSSFAAMNDFSKGLRPGHVYSEADWNPIDYESAKQAAGPIAYGGSKKLAEAAAWDFMEKASTAPKFTLSTILPTMVYGPLLDSSASLESLNTSSADIYRLMNGTLDKVPPTLLPAFVDVRDVALAHLRAYEHAESGRFVVNAGSFTYQEVCDILGKQLPDASKRVPATRCTDGSHYSIDNTRASSILGIKFKNIDECFGDMAKRFVDIESRNSNL